LLGVSDATLSYHVCEWCFSTCKETHLSLSVLCAEHASLDFLPATHDEGAHLYVGSPVWTWPQAWAAYHALPGTCVPASPRDEEAERSSPGTAELLGAQTQRPAWLEAAMWIALWWLSHWP